MFWRAPDGRPHKADQTKFAPVALLKELGETAEVEQGGAVSYKGFSPHTHEAAISWLAVILQPTGEELSEEDTSRILQAAVLNILRKKGGGIPLRSEEVLKESDRLAAEHFRLPLLNYTLKTSLSVDQLPIDRINVNGCAIQSSKSEAKRHYNADVLEKLNHVAFLREHFETTHYRQISVHATGRCIHEASNSALSAIHLVRGLWTLFATFGQMSIHFGVRRQIPLGVIHVGPVHALHRRDGSGVDDAFWYDPEYVEDQKLFTPRNGWEQIEKGRRWALRRIRSLPYRSDIERLVIRYVQALDEANRDVAFINLWGILEKLTGTIGANYDETIRRAVRPFPNREAVKECDSPRLSDSGGDRIMVPEGGPRDGIIGASRRASWAAVV